jgi:hypothetical protein
MSMRGERFGSNNFSGPRRPFLVLGFLVFACFVLMSARPALASTCTVPPHGMVGWWPGDGNAKDITPHDHDGTLQGATFTSGEVGQAFKLDGADDYVDIPNKTDLNIPGGKITIDAWINPASGNQFYTGILNKGDVGNFKESYALFLTPSNTIGFLVNTNGTSAGRRIVFGTEPIPTNEVELFNRVLTGGNAAMSGGELGEIYTAGTAGKCKCQEEADAKGDMKDDDGHNSSVEMNAKPDCEDNGETDFKDDSGEEMKGKNNDMEMSGNTAVVRGSGTLLDGTPVDYTAVLVGNQPIIGANLFSITWTTATGAVFHRSGAMIDGFITIPLASSPLPLPLPPPTLVVPLPFGCSSLPSFGRLGLLTRSYLINTFKPFRACELCKLA